MDKLITWFDVETIVRSRMFAGSWPQCLVGISVFSDEVEIRIKSEEDKAEVSQALTAWFGLKYSQPEKKILLECSTRGEKRSLAVVFEIEPNGKQMVPETLKPNFATFSLYPEAPNLKGPDFDHLAKSPSIWAFYSFKGGVGRTLHLISLVKALSEQDPPKSVLIVDADLEAPGLTWWAEEELGKAEISFLDFLGLAHYDHSADYTAALELTAERIRRQMLVFETKKTRVEHFFLPSFREIQQLMRMPIRPENVCWESGKEWIITELLWKLGKHLGVDTVLVDLRAGLSEISSPLLFDPRVNRVIVTTPSGQSVQGTKRVLEQIGKVSSALQIENHDYESYLPIVILSMIKEDIKDILDIENIKQELKESILPETAKSDKSMEKEVLLESLFDENLLYLKNLKTTLEKLDKSDLHAQMSRIANEWFPTQINEAKDILPKDEKKYYQDLTLLRDIAREYEFAESGKATDFLVTQYLKSMARKFENTLPVAVIMGGKGSGKTYTYLQLAFLKGWRKFIEKAGLKKEAAHGLIWPLLSSKNLEEKGKEIVSQCRKHAMDIKKDILHFNPLTNQNIETQMDRQKESKGNTLSSWRDFWLRLMAQSLSCNNTSDPLTAMQEQLAKSDSRIVFQIDGLEDHFQNIGNDEQEQLAIRALCQSVVEALLEWSGNRIGLLIFIRKDLVKSAIQQNFGQFESRYQSLELKWDRGEALRLVAWLVNKAAGLEKYVRFSNNQLEIENVSSEAIEKALEGLWGLKLGNPSSREANTVNWVIPGLSDLKGQLQARDLIRLLRFAAENALLSTTPRYEDRLLPPSAIKAALAPCSTHKIEEIEKEITILKTIFEKLRKIKEEDKLIPFDREVLGLSASDIQTMTKLGIVLEYEGKYYMPEIIRLGLGFRWDSRGRAKVLWLQKQARFS